MIFEFSAISAPLSSKSEWRQRLSTKEAIFPKQLPDNAIIFLAQSKKDPFFEDELDAMWVALMHGVKTLNGYTGLYPPGFNLQYGDDCKELPRRVLSYLLFSGNSNNKEAYLSIMKKVVPIGFEVCDERWMKVPPKFTTTHHEYTAREIGKLSFKFIGKTKYRGQWVVSFKIVNSNDIPISAASSLGKPIRISWRFVNSSGGHRYA